MIWPKKPRKASPPPARITVIYVRNEDELVFLREAIPVIAKMHFGADLPDLVVPIETSPFVPPNRACVIWSDGRIQFSHLRKGEP